MSSIPSDHLQRHARAVGEIVPDAVVQAEDPVEIGLRDRRLLLDGRRRPVGFRQLGFGVDHDLVVRRKQRRAARHQAILEAEVEDVIGELPITRSRHL